VTGTGFTDAATWYASPAGMLLQHEELDDYQFTDPAAVGDYLPPFIAPRIPAALTARASGAATYLPSTF
jgi:8-oxo-dGTP diphosphatase